MNHDLEPESLLSSPSSKQSSGPVISVDTRRGLLALRPAAGWGSADVALRDGTSQSRDSPMIGVRIALAMGTGPAPVAEAYLCSHSPFRAWRTSIDKPEDGPEQ